MFLTLPLPFVPITTQSVAPQTVANQASALRRKADETTADIGKLASSGKLAHDEESIKLLRKLVDELDDIRKRLDVLEKKSPAPAAAGNAKVSGYMQFNLVDSNRVAGALNDGFQSRRLRLVTEANPDPRTSLKVQLDAASGANEQQVLLKDAWVSYRINDAGNLPYSFRVGQQTLPIGFELQQSDADREFPERTLYNRSLFLGERGRGLIFSRAFNGLTTIHYGVIDALTTEEPEQANLTSAAGGRYAAIAAIRTQSKIWSAGLSGIGGQRPAYTVGAVTAPAVARSFVVADAEYGFKPGSKWRVHGEVLYGQDRLPTATPSATAFASKMNAFQIQLKYTIDQKSDFNVRYEGFQPNADTPGAYMRGYGISYRHFLTPNYLVMLAYDSYVDEGRFTSLHQTAYEVATMRFQIRF